MRKHTNIFIGVVLFALSASSCTNDRLGLGEADCSSPQGGISSSNVMTVQAVPTAKYTPCLDERRLGWDSVEWFAERGRAGIEISRDDDPFLTASVSEECDVSNALAVDSAYPDIRQFEDIEAQQAETEIVVIPSGEVPLEAALELVEELGDTQVDDRPVIYTVDIAISEPVSSRSDAAVSRGSYVWIIDELDVEEGTVQQRSNHAAAVGRGLEPGDALDLIEGTAPGVFYRGRWFFTFEGGCITYEFDANGILAETVAADARDAIGFYPAGEVRRAVRDAGFEIE